MLLTDDFLQRWGEIVDGVDKNHIPINCVKKIVFRTRAKRQKTINIRRFRDQGVEENAIENAVENYIREHEDDIVSMEFILDIETVAGILQPETDRILKGM
jgi:Asp-tRNA(Asn)/Glu-tRNA(Gln) amidotransferase B subunit